jgi:leucyl-tRNA synthetase
MSLSLARSDVFSSALYRTGLKSAFYNFTAAHDSYRVSVNAAGIGIHGDLVRRYIEFQARLMARITARWAGYTCWGVLGKVRITSLRE